MGTDDLKNMIINLVGLAETHYNEVWAKKVDDECAEIINRLDELQAFKDKQEQGLLIELPVAEGTPVYEIDRNCKHEGHCYFDTMCNGCKYEEAEYGIHETKFTAFDLSRVGKTVFLTHKQAEAALAKMGGKQ